MWIVATARGACRLRGVTKNLYCCNSVTGSADCVEIWYVVGCPLSVHFTKGMGRVPSSARAHVHTALLYLRNGLTDCVRIWWVGCGPWTMCFPQVMGGISLHVRTCTPYLRISRTDWPIVLKFDVWLDTQMLRGLQKLEVGWLHIRTYVSSFVVTETAEPCPWSRTKNRFISFALARSSPNKASYWLILTVNLWSSANKFAAKLKTQHFHKTP